MPLPKTKQQNAHLLNWRDSTSQIWPRLSYTYTFNCYLTKFYATSNFIPISHFISFHGIMFVHDGYSDSRLFGYIYYVLDQTVINVALSSFRSDIKNTTHFGW